MFCIKIAGIPVGIDNRYPYVRQLCSGYEINEERPAFTVHADEKDILREQNGNLQFSKEYCEGLCLFRNICYELIRYDASLMHSAVVVMDCEAYVFAAPSGVGKTTHIVRWLEQFQGKARVLNGDKPVFRFCGDTLYACGTPWKGKEELGSNMTCPVRAVCFLEQSRENYIRALKKNEVSRYIFPQVLLPDTPEQMDHFLNLLEKMITTVDFYLLQCNQSLEAAQIAYDTMRRK